MAQKDIEQFVDTGSEKRLHLRFPVVLPIDFGKADYFLSSICSNVSQNGLFIETSKDFAVGERVCLFVSLPNQDDPVKLIGEVMWTTKGECRDIHDRQVNGIGIKFLGENPEGDQLLKGFLRRSGSDDTFLVATEENSLVL